MRLIDTHRILHTFSTRPVLHIYVQLLLDSNCTMMKFMFASYNEKGNVDSIDRLYTHIVGITALLRMFVGLYRNPITTRTITLQRY